MQKIVHSSTEQLYAVWKKHKGYERHWENSATYIFLEERDEVVPVLLLLETCEIHFCARDVLHPYQMSRQKEKIV